jgi:hypothetical protein
LIPHHRSRSESGPLCQGIAAIGLVFPRRFVAGLNGSIDRLPVIDARVSVRNSGLLIFACEAARSGSL